MEFFAVGECNLNDTKTGIYLQSYAGTNEMQIISTDVRKFAENINVFKDGMDECCIAWIECDYKSKEHFDAVVTESKYFSVGEKFVFRRLQ